MPKVKEAAAPSEKETTSFTPMELKLNHLAEDGSLLSSTDTSEKRMAIEAFFAQPAEIVTALGGLGNLRTVRAFKSAEGAWSFKYLTKVGVEQAKLEEAKKAEKTAKDAKNERRNQMNAARKTLDAVGQQIIDHTLGINKAEKLKPFQIGKTLNVSVEKVKAIQAAFWATVHGKPAGQTA